MGGAVNILEDLATGASGVDTAANNGWTGINGWNTIFQLGADAVSGVAASTTLSAAVGSPAANATLILTTGLAAETAALQLASDFRNGDGWGVLSDFGTLVGDGLMVLAVS